MRDSRRALLLMAAGVTFLVTALWGAYVLPHWLFLPALVSVVVGGCYVGYRGEYPRDLRRERAAKGQCLACSYDLRGNVSGVCPECGAIR